MTIDQRLDRVEKALSRWRAFVLVAGVALAAAVAVGAQRVKRPTIPEQVIELRAELDELTKRVEALEVEVQVLKPSRQGAGDAGDDPGADANDRVEAITRGLRDRKLAVGMTLKQVQQIAGSRGTLDSAVANVETYVFESPGSAPLIRDNAPSNQTSTWIVSVDFQNGKVVGFSQVLRQNRAGAVSNPGATNFGGGR